MVMNKEAKKESDRFMKHWAASKKAEAKGMPPPPLPEKDGNEGKIDVDHGEAVEIEKHSRLGFWAKVKLKYRTDSTFLIRMSYSNGTVRQFLIVTKNEVFRYGKRTFYLRYEDAEYNISHGQYELRFHEDYPCPIDREILLLPDEGQTDPEAKTAFFSVTSHNLRPLIKMEYIKALAEAQELSKYLKMALILGVFTLVIIMLLAYYQLKSAGVIG